VCRSPWPRSGPRGGEWGLHFMRNPKKPTGLTADHLQIKSFLLAIRHTSTHHPGQTPRLDLLDHLCRFRSGFFCESRVKSQESRINQSDPNAMCCADWDRLSSHHRPTIYRWSYYHGRIPC
jgi:hypothetical protein